MNSSISRTSIMVVASVLSLGSVACPDRPYGTVVDMPVSLAIGIVRTPEFAHSSHGYWIMLQVEKPLPFKDMLCMTGVKDATPDFKNCPKEPLIDANWTLLSDGLVVSQGSSSGFGDAIFTDEHIFKFLGSFSTLVGKKYVLEVRFTKDGSALNVANPHLIVVRQWKE